MLLCVVWTPSAELRLFLLACFLIVKRDLIYHSPRNKLDVASFWRGVPKMMCENVLALPWNRVLGGLLVSCAPRICPLLGIRSLEQKNRGSISTVGLGGRRVATLLAKSVTYSWGWHSSRNGRTPCMIASAPLLLWHSLLYSAEVDASSASCQQSQ